MLRAQFLSQDVGLEQVIIHGNDGSVYKGYVLNKKEFEIELLLPTMDTIHVHDMMIDKMRSSKELDLHRKGRYHFNSGFYGGMAFSSNYAGINSSNSLNALLAYRMSPKYDVGVFTGIQGNGSDFGSDGWDVNTFFNVDAYARYNLNKRSVRVYADTKIGYGFPVDDWEGNQFDGGLHVEPGIGIRFASKNNFRFTIGLSQYFQYSEGQSSQFVWGAVDNVDINYEVWYSRTMLSIGFQLF